MWAMFAYVDPMHSLKWTALRAMCSLTTRLESSKRPVTDPESGFATGQSTARPSVAFRRSSLGVTSGAHAPADDGSRTAVPTGWAATVRSIETFPALVPTRVSGVLPGSARVAFREPNQ